MANTVAYLIRSLVTKKKIEHATRCQSYKKIPLSLMLWTIKLGCFPGTPFKPSLVIASKARVYPNTAPERCSILSVMASWPCHQMFDKTENTRPGQTL
jgi:hypothetical protein